MSIMCTHLTERDTYEGKQLAEDRAKLSRFNLASQSADGQMEKDMKEVV